MTMNTAQQAKTMLQNMTESLWLFASLNVLIESGAFTLLREPATLPALEQTSGIPTPILKQTINLLVETGFVAANNDSYELATGMKLLAEKIGIEKITAQLRTAFGLSHEFIRSARERTLRTGWHYTDEIILQAQGTHSEYIVTDCIPQDAELHDLLNQPGKTFLDVGAGVAKLSICLCQQYPDLQVVALEPADVPHALAVRNIQHANFKNRIDLRKVLLEDLDETNAYDVIWFPHVFIEDQYLNSCLKSAWQALKPGGILMTVAIDGSVNNTSTTIKKLLNSLYGGLRSSEDVSNALSAASFSNIKIFGDAAGYRNMTARKN